MLSLDKYGRCPIGYVQHNNMCIPRYLAVQPAFFGGDDFSPTPPIPPPVPPTPPPTPAPAPDGGTGGNVGRDIGIAIAGTAAAAAAAGAAKAGSNYLERQRDYAERQARFAQEEEESLGLLQNQELQDQADDLLGGEQENIWQQGTRASDARRADLEMQRRNVDEMAELRQKQAQELQRDFVGDTRPVPSRDIAKEGFDETGLTPYEQKQSIFNMQRETDDLLNPADAGDVEMQSKSLMEDVDLSKDPKVSVSQEEAELRAELEGEGYSVPSNEASDSSNLMSIEEDASAQGTRPDILAVQESGDEEGANKMFLEAIEGKSGGLPGGNPNYEMKQSVFLEPTELPTTNKMANSVVKTAGELGIGEEAAAGALIDPIAALGVAALEGAVYAGVATFALDEINTARGYKGEEAWFADVGIHQIDTEKERKFWENYLEDVAETRNRYDSISTEELNKMSPQERRKFENEQNKITHQERKIAETMKNSSVEKDIIDVEIKETEDGITYPVFSISEKPTAESMQNRTLDLNDVVVKGGKASYRPPPQTSSVVNVADRQMEQVKQAPMTYEQKQARFNEEMF